MIRANPRFFDGCGLVARVVLAAVFLLACTGKIVDPAAFSNVIFYYQLLPHGLINLLAITLPWIELITALALLLGRRYRAAAALLAIAMLAVFSAAMGINLARGVDISCGCFSSAAHHEGGLTGWNIARNVGLIALAAVVLLREKTRWFTTPRESAA